MKLSCLSGIPTGLILIFPKNSHYLKIFNCAIDGHKLNPTRWSGTVVTLEISKGPVSIHFLSFLPKEQKMFLVFAQNCHIN